MLTVGNMHRIMATALLCTMLPIAAASCTSQGEANIEPTITPTSQPVVQQSRFTTQLTKEGHGLVRDVPACSNSSYVRQPIVTSVPLDVRWLNCPKYLDNSQLQQLISSAPYITFNSDTIWPDNMPLDYDPAAIMEAGKNPGLGINELHNEGITGKGVSIAIIDSILFTGHREYKDNLALYEEVHVIPGEPASMHGSGVSSIAVGKTTGVAPDAKLYYWAIDFAIDPHKRDGSDSNIAFASGLSVAIDRMLEVNASLSKNEKIRVLSIARGFTDLQNEGVQTFINAINRAQDAGIFVITTSTFQYSAFMSQETDFSGLGKVDLLGDPDSLSTYTLGRFEQVRPDYFLNNLLVPMDARTTADPCGESDYAFYSNGGWSWVAPYLAGLYALAAQVDPDLTPEMFWNTALNTSNKLTVTLNGEQYTFNHVINPTGLIDALR